MDIHVFPTEIVHMFLESIRSEPESLWGFYMASRETQRMVLDWLRGRPRYLMECLWYGFTEGFDHCLVELLREKMIRVDTRSPRTVKLLGADTYDPDFIIETFGLEALRWYARQRSALGWDLKLVLSKDLHFLLDPPGTPIHHTPNLAAALRLNYRILEVAEALGPNAIRTDIVMNPEVSDDTYVAISHLFICAFLVRTAIEANRVELVLRLWRFVHVDTQICLIKQLPKDKYRVAVELCKASSDLDVDWFIYRTDLEGHWGVTEERVRRDFHEPSARKPVLHWP